MKNIKKIILTDNAKNTKHYSENSTENRSFSRISHNVFTPKHVAACVRTQTRRNTFLYYVYSEKHRRKSRKMPAFELLRLDVCTIKPSKPICGPYSLDHVRLAREK